MSCRDTPCRAQLSQRAAPYFGTLASAITGWIFRHLSAAHFAREQSYALILLVGRDPIMADAVAYLGDLSELSYLIGSDLSATLDFPFLTVTLTSWSSLCIYGTLT